MIHHVVLFKLKPQTTDIQRNRMVRAVRELKDKIPGIVFIDAGHNFSNRNKGYEMMLMSQFLTKADLETYLAHPDHQYVVERFIAPLREDLIVGDLES